MNELQRKLHALLDRAHAGSLILVLAPRRAGISTFFEQASASGAFECVAHHRRAATTWERKAKNANNRYHRDTLVGVQRHFSLLRGGENQLTTLVDTLPHETLVPLLEGDLEFNEVKGAWPTAYKGAIVAIFPQFSDAQARRMPSRLGRVKRVVQIQALTRLPHGQPLAHALPMTAKVESVEFDMQNNHDVYCITATDSMLFNFGDAAIVDTSNTLRRLAVLPNTRVTFVKTTCYAEDLRIFVDDARATLELLDALDPQP